MIRISKKDEVNQKFRLACIFSSVILTVLFPVHNLLNIYITKTSHPILLTFNLIRLVSLISCRHLIHLLIYYVGFQKFLVFIVAIFVFLG